MPRRCEAGARENWVKGPRGWTYGFPCILEKCPSKSEETFFNSWDELHKTFSESGNHKNWYVYLSPKRALQVYVLLVLTTSDTVCPHVIYLILLVPVVSGWLAWPEKPTLTLRGSISCAISASVAASSQFSSFLASRYSSEMLWVCLR